MNDSLATIHWAYGKKQEDQHPKIIGRTATIKNKPYILEDWWGVLSDKAPYETDHMSPDWRKKMQEAQVFFDPPMPEPVTGYQVPPNAMEVYEYSQDGKKGHFYVHDGQIWDSGRPMTAFDMWNAKQAIQNGGILFGGQEALNKAEGDESEAIRSIENHGLAKDLMQYLKEAQADSSHQSHIYETLFRDSMTPELGNRLAYEQFMQQPKQGVHLIADANGFGYINEKHGEAQGDESIKHLASQLRHAVNMAGLANSAAAHRIGGDEFHVWVPTLGDAKNVLSAWSNAIQTGHRPQPDYPLSVSVGVAASPRTAFEAMQKAKQQKSQDISRLGGHGHEKLQAPRFVYAFSNLGGHYGDLSF